MDSFYLKEKHEFLILKEKKLYCTVLYDLSTQGLMVLLASLLSFPAVFFWSLSVSFKFVAVKTIAGLTALLCYSVGPHSAAE